MNKMNQQKFMTIFNNMLSDRNGTKISNILEPSFGGDEIDRVNHHKDESLNLRLDQRNILFLKKVKEAKKKILNGTYGACEDCEGEISQKRLLARPMANLCINCQEEKERNEFGTFEKRRDLSVKKFLVEEQESEQSETKVEKFNSIKDIGFESVMS